MKKYIYTLVTLSTLLWSCGGGGDDTPTPDPVNHAPTTPTLVYPTADLLCLENPVECKWNVSTDLDGDVITYLLEVAKNNSFTDGKQTFTSQTPIQSVPLLEDVAYYWRVKATDSKNAASSYSSVFKFYTYGIGVVNHVPFSPELVSPQLNTTQTGTTATLQWTASDVDTTDTLTYDVYFGTDENPVLVTPTSISTTSFVTPTLSTSTTYYWKIVVIDGKGGQTIGQIWNFTTD